MSSLKDLASLIMVPSLVKDGRLDTVKPLGNSIIHPDATGNNDGTDGSTPAEGNFTFSRGSNLAATRVDVNGLIEKGRENVLTYSNDLNNGVWNHTDVSSTGGQSGYDGSNDAWLLNSSSGSNSLRRNISVSGINTFSIYAKAGTGNGIRIRFDQDTDCNAYIDLTDGSVFTEGNTLSINVYSISGGWYRISVAMNNIGLNLFRLIVTDGTTTTTAGTIYIQDAQLEQGLVATDYIETGASTAQAGILEDLPRLDYSGGASCPALLLEPLRTNAVLHSEYFSSSSGYWINVRSTIETNSTTSPEGANNASKILQDSATTNAGVIVKSITASGSNTFSFFAKKGSVNFARLSLNSGTETSAYFNLENGEVGTTNSISESDCFIEDMGNDWYRCGATYSGATNRFNIYLGDRDGITTLLDASNAYIYIYGAQWEASSSYPTSYIPTMGSAVTRSKDATTITDLQGKGVYPSLSEGTFFLDLEVNGRRDAAGSYRHIRLVNNIDSASNRIRIYEGNNGVTSYIRADLTGGVVEQGFSADTQNKLAVTWGSEGTKIYKNGELAQSTAIQLSFTSTQKVLTNVFSNYNFNQVLMFPTALTDSECIALTTI